MVQQGLNSFGTETGELEKRERRGRIQPILPYVDLTCAQDGQSAHASAANRDAHDIWT